MPDRAERFPAEPLPDNRAGHMTGDQARRFERMVVGRRQRTRGLAMPIGAIAALLLIMSGPPATAATRHLTGRSATWFVCLSVLLEASSGGARTAVAIFAQQPLTIEGEVKDTAGQPLPGVSVTALPEGGGRATLGMTVRDGTYRLEALAGATHRIDFELRGFTGIRRNHVLAGRDGRARIDAVLGIRPIYECVGAAPPRMPRDVQGQVLDEAGRPLPYARLEMAGVTRSERAIADNAGQFRVR